MAKVVMKMYYDSYEGGFGDGFYPQIVPESEEWASIDIEFTLSEDGTTWRQSTERSIKGLDGTSGYVLLVRLNNQVEGKATTIFSQYDKIFPKK